VDNNKYPLDTADIAILLDALNAWESKDLASDMLHTILSASFLKPKDGMEAIQQEQKERERQEKLERERATRKEISIVLQAKLISLRNRVTADAFVSSALGGQS